MAVKITETLWFGQKALALENEGLRIVIIPQMGAKIVSLMDTLHGIEWLVGPQKNNFGPVPYGAIFIEQDMSGWDEMFPTINACEYPLPGEYEGAFLPDHGEVWSIPWDVESMEDGALRMSVEGRALPYRLTRTLSILSPDTLEMSYSVENLGSETFPYIWAAHPQFDMGDSAEIILPFHVRRMISVTGEEWGWGPQGTGYDWPAAMTHEVQPIRLDQVGPPALKRARKLFIEKDARIGWATLLRTPSEAWLQMQWSPIDIPYFGVWVDEGALGSCSVATPEPMTGFYDSVTTARENQEIISLTPGQKRGWSLTVTVGKGKETLKTG